MLSVGLTGGIASGKSTVAKMFQEKGAYLIDLDVMVRSVEEPGAPVWKRIVEDFGSKILNEDGTINREKLGAIVFCDKEKLEKLNEIVHPVVFGEWKQQIADIEKNDPDAIVVSDIPLLIEVGKVDEVDLVVLVYISQEEQIRRLIERDRCSRKEALARIDSQMPIDKKLWYSDFVVDNGGSLEETAEQVSDIWERFLEREKQI
ncbi:MAG: dephospho-CoA kinase [Syntrophales bacterium]|nr:dephospho-CoA kinase [Syntrophales bacterium]